MAGLTRAAAASLYDPPSRKAYLRAIRQVGVYQRKPRLRVADPMELVDPDQMIQLMCIASGNWQVTTTELGGIVQLAMKHRPHHIFEIGTFDGRTTLNLHLNCPEAQITTMDLPPEDQDLPDGKVAGSLIREHAAAGRITQIYGNTLNYDFSDFYGQCDFVFIDAGHSYPNAAADTRTAIRLTQGRRAVIVWHDYAEWPGVTRAVEELAGQLVKPLEIVQVRETSLAVLACGEGQTIELKDPPGYH